MLVILTHIFLLCIRILNDMDFTPYVFSRRIQEFRAEQFQTAATGDSFPLGNSLTNHALFLLRYLLVHCKKWIVIFTKLIVALVA